jgi:hypothetical protein
MKQHIHKMSSVDKEEGRHKLNTIIAYDFSIQMEGI